MKVEKSSSNTTTAKQEALQQQQQQLHNQLQNRKCSVWSREKINQLIELYKKHECLWNHWHEAYKNKDKRNRAIEDICNKLQIPKFEFGKKIHNLRNQFNTEMKKLEQRIEEAGVSMDDPNAMDLRCKWSHFESLMFLRHVIEPRPGGYQTNFPPKKMRLKFDYNSAEDDINSSSVLPNSSGNSTNSTNPDDIQFQYDENVTEEVITDDYQSFENEVVEVEENNCRDEVYDQKYQPPTSTQTSNNPELSNISTRSFTKSTNNKKNSHNSSVRSSAQTEIININEDSSIIELSTNNLTVVPSNNHIISSASITSPSITTPIISAISSSSSNRPASVLRDQWDAFGELVANEFRNLNSEISRKRLKRKIMQAMLEVGEEDDNLLTSRSGSNN